MKLVHESTDETIFIDFKYSIGNDIKRYDNHGLVSNECNEMKRVEYGDIHSLKNIPVRVSPVYEDNKGWFLGKSSRNIQNYDLPFLTDSFMLCVYSFMNFKNIYKTAIFESEKNYVGNIKFDINSFYEVTDCELYHRIGLINTDGSDVSIVSNDYEINEFVKGLSFFYLEPGCKLSISKGNRFCMIGSLIQNNMNNISPIIESKKRKYRDLNSDSFSYLSERLK